MKKILFALLLITLISLFTLNKFRTNIKISQQGTSFPVVTQQVVPILEPQRFVIPSLDIDTSVESVGKDKLGRMDVPKSAHTVGWWNLGVKPGEQGSAVIAGHLDTPEGLRGIFYDLGNLNVGDQIQVYDAQNGELKFEVIRQEIFLDSNFPIGEVFAKSDDNYLNLITCQGAFDALSKNYDKRLVVFTKLVEEDI